MRKWAFGIGTTVILVPALALGWNHLGKVWGAPKKIETVEQAGVQQAETQETLKEIATQQKQRLELIEKDVEHSDEIQKLQVEALKELILEIRR